MNAQAENMVLASFVGDSLALGAHWLYDTKELREKIGHLDGLRKPLAGSYHANKEKGDFTHYGDQELFLLKSLVRNSGFSAENFASEWRQYMQSYTGYLDKASKTTLTNMEEKPLTESGSSSNDLGGAARIAPLVFLYRDDKKALLATAIAQTKVTHNNPASLTGAAFLANVAWEVLHGADPAEATTALVIKGVADIGLDTRLQAALDSVDKDSLTIIKEFGQMCGIDSALPSVVHLVLKYNTDLPAALIANVYAGGDSAARGMSLGMVVGAAEGCTPLPSSWLTELRQYAHINELLTALKKVQNK